MKLFRRESLFERKRKHKDIDPDEIFLDSSNLPNFDVNQFEGRLEKPVSKPALFLIGIFFLLISLMSVGRLWKLQIVQGDSYLSISENNRLNHKIIFSQRGIIVDRRGTSLAWNEPLSKIIHATSTDNKEVEKSTPALREYYKNSGLAHILGYVSYPKKDQQGFYFQEDTIGKEGVEFFYNELLAGENGKRLTETNAVGEQLSQTLIYQPTDGALLNLAIDAEVQSKLFTNIKDLAEDIGFSGGSGVILDILNGEVLALTSYPEYDSAILTDGSNIEKIQEFVEDTHKPFLNRALAGLYTPGSIIKPFIAAGALDKNIISPEKEIFSSGQLEVPNPYNPSQPSIFKDWKAHGWVDMRQAIAVSSNVYFYQIGGGYTNENNTYYQQGLGIAGIEKYISEFGIGSQTGIDLIGEMGGTIPNPAWKASQFPGDPWRLGDTYNTAIGQYGFQVTPLQMARATAAIANGGFLVRPHLQLDERVAPRERIDIEDTDLQIIREGMRRGVLEGTAKGLNMPQIEIAAKTGTAELGSSKEKVNSWVIGFFPYETPRYAFAVVMERGPAKNLIGSLFVMRQLFEWMSIHTPEYLAQ